MPADGPPFNSCPHCKGFASLADGEGGTIICPQCGGTGRAPTIEPPFICTECREGDHEHCWHDDDPYGPECECDHKPSPAIEPPFITYAMEDGELIFGEFSFTTSLDGFEDRDAEVRLIKRTYRLLSEEVVVLPDPYPIEEDEEEDDDDLTAAGAMGDVDEADRWRARHA